MTTKKAFTDEEYFKLSEAVYQDGTLNSKKIKIELSYRTKSNWKVVSKLNDRATNTQAFAVIPEEKGKDGKIYYNHNNMIFVYRGTKESKDFGSDIINVFAGKNSRTSLDRKSKNPFQVSKEWTEEVLKEFNPKNPTSTGHSLGGALSHYNSILYDFNATTYAAPNIYQLLPEDKQKKVRDGFYNNSIIDFTHDDDMIRTFDQFSSPIVGSQYIAERNNVKVGVKGVFGAIPGHYNETFEGCFSSDGTMKLKVDVDSIIKHAQDIDNIIQSLQTNNDDLENLEEKLQIGSKKIQNQLEEEIRIGGVYSELTTWDIDDVLTELCTKYKNGVYCFYNPNEFEKYYEMNHQTRRLLKNFQIELVDAAQSFRETNTSLGEWISNNN
ncbi:TPA: hypothetical protein OK954_002798 [Listeria monocytogenes]|nr:hypothetical protein [Listeria monocytogenes]